MSSMAAKSPKSRTGPSTPVTSETCRTRRKRAQEARESGDAEASSSLSIEETNGAGPSQKSEVDTNGFGDEEFIAFFASDGEEGELEVYEEAKSFARELDKGKGMEQEHEGAGRKRKAEEIDYNDGYASKKERIDANSRRAPWAAEVDWDDCKNVAEMFVSSQYIHFRWLALNVTTQAAPRGGRVRKVYVTVSSRGRSSMPYCDLNLKRGYEDVPGCTSPSVWKLSDQVISPSGVSTIATLK